MYESDPLAAKRIREALAAPIEDKEKIDAPKLKPVDQLERMPLKPLPVRGPRKVVPR